MRPIQKNLMKSKFILMLFVLSGLLLQLPYALGQNKKSREKKPPAPLQGDLIEPLPEEKSVPVSPKESGAPVAVPEKGFDAVTFEKLASFEFEMSEEVIDGAKDPQKAREKSQSQIPVEVKEYDQKKVALQGYMLPLKVEGGAVVEFLIMRDQSMCCYGTIPKINEWVSVKMVKDGVKAVMDQPVTVYGKLHVGELRENGYLVGIYKMDGEKLTAVATP
jgi:hypothetical protein